MAASLTSARPLIGPDLAAYFAKYVRVLHAFTGNHGSKQSSPLKTIYGVLQVSLYLVLHNNTPYGQRLC